MSKIIQFKKEKTEHRKTEHGTIKRESGVLLFKGKLY